MPGLLLPGGIDRKRKRPANTEDDLSGANPRKAPRKTPAREDVQAKILLLEEQVLYSREHYNNIAQLHALVENVEKRPKTATLAAVALCRIFCRLITEETFASRKQASAVEHEVTRWLTERLRTYVGTLTSWIGSPSAAQESTALTLLMRVVKVEVSQGTKRSEQAWRTPNSTFPVVIETLLREKDAEAGRQEFVGKYVEEHDDVRFYTLVAIKEYLTKLDGQDSQAISNALDLLSQMEGIPDSEAQLEDWYGQAPAQGSRQLLSLNAHRKMAQEAWLTIFRSLLSRDGRKKILNISTTHILPWFATRMELLTDFLTDSFNEGGSLALLALSSIFQLMTEKNLDYPEFYNKLYSLLDDDMVHSKHRSRFFRMLDTFMRSTHLPAAMVASFIKRLARLALQAPPGAIVWVIPWTYNMLKQHPACTFMLQRSYHPAHAIYAQNTQYDENGIVDLFSMDEPDPMLTNAIDSSLWELEMLQSHYHPNVATLAKIMGEQFTKRDYQLEDFLDHSYTTLVNAELGKVMRKVPVVEWEIPKRIVTAADEEGGGLNRLGGLLQSAIDGM